MEIFVFLAAVNDMTRLECIPLHASKDGETGREAAEEAVFALFRAFTVGHCLCHDPDTRDKLLSIIEAGIGTLDDFDALIRNLQIPFMKNMRHNTITDSITDGQSPDSPTVSPRMLARSITQGARQAFARTFSNGPKTKARLAGPADTLDFAEQVKDP